MDERSGTCGDVSNENWVMLSNVLRRESVCVDYYLSSPSAQESDTNTPSSSSLVSVGFSDRSDQDVDGYEE